MSSTGTTEAADHLAIEGLADRLTDEQWTRRLTEHADAVANCSRCSSTTAALLAHLREVGENLPPRARIALAVQYVVPLWNYETPLRRALHGLLVEGDPPDGDQRTPKGRAVAALLTSRDTEGSTDG